MRRVGRKSRYVRLFGFMVLALPTLFFVMIAFIAHAAAIGAWKAGMERGREVRGELLPVWRKSWKL